MPGIHRRIRPLAVAVVASVILSPTVGCSKFNYVPVKGKVVLKKTGKPVTLGTVVFMPDKDNPLRQVASGTINADGTYELKTEGRSGVPTGSYIACVRGPMRKVDGKDPPPIPFSMKYFDANESPLKIEVVENPAAGAYDLELVGN